VRDVVGVLGIGGVTTVLLLIGYGVGWLIRAILER